MTCHHNSKKKSNPIGPLVYIQLHTRVVSNNLDPDQAQHSVGPDPGPNCLQRSSADHEMTKSSREAKGKEYMYVLLLTVETPKRV